MRGDRELVVVLCDSYIEAEEAYEIFKEYMERHESWIVQRYYDSSNGLTTRDGYAFIFIDARMVNVFADMTNSIEYVQEFFDEIMTDTEERKEYETWTHQRKRLYSQLQSAW